MFAVCAVRGSALAFAVLRDSDNELSNRGSLIDFAAYHLPTHTEISQLVARMTKLSAYSVVVVH